MDRLNRTLLIGTAVLVSTQITFITLAFASADSVPVGLAMGTAAMCQVALVGLCLRGWRRPLGPPLIWLGVAIGTVGVVAGSSLVWLENDLARSLQVTVPSTGMSSVQLFIVATARRVRWTVLCVAVCGAVFLALNAPSGITWETIDQWVSPSSSTLALAFLVVHLRSGATYAADLADLNQATQQRALAAAADETARAEARRVIHDDVIAGLWAVEHELPRAECRSAAADALAALSRHRELVTRTELVATLSADQSVRVQLLDEGWPVDPPARVLEAFGVAAAEALRNVARHSGVDRATVRLASTESALIVQVIDSGRGVGSSGRGFGTSESMTGRMTSVGGTARVEPGPDAGTVATLTWPVPPTRVDQVLPYHAGRPLRGYVPPACVFAAGNLFLAWRHPGPHAVANLCLATALAVFLPLTGWWLGTHESRWRDLPLVVLVSSGAAALGLWLAGDGALLDYRSWVVGMASSVIVLFAFGAPVLATLVAAIPIEAVVLWFAAHDPTITLWEPVGALNAPIVLCGFSAMFGALLRQGTRVIQQQQALLAASLDDQAWHRAQEAARTVHLSALRDDIAPVLETVVRGDVVEPGRAAVLSARCRDELSLADPLSPDVRAAVDAARERGTQVTFRFSSSGMCELLNQAVVTILSKAPAQLVTVYPGEDPRLVVLPPLRSTDERQIASALGASATVTSDAERTIIAAAPTLNR